MFDAREEFLTIQSVIESTTHEPQSRFGVRTRTAFSPAVYPAVARGLANLNARQYSKVATEGDFMNYIAVDFEFNQSIKKPNPYTGGASCPFEIIQIGAVKINDRMEIIDKFNYLIKPQIHMKLHPYVLKLTGLNYDRLGNGCSFVEAYSKFKEFTGGDSVLCVWGIYDLTALSNNIIYYNPQISKLVFNYINVQDMASKYLHQPSGMAIGLKNAVERLGLSEDILFHDALNDAIYTAKIFESVKPDKTEIRKFSCKNKRKRT